MINFTKTTYLVIVLVVVFLAAGFFAYQWWQVKGELAKQIEQNVDLTKEAEKLRAEIDKLQKEIERLKITGETADWKTYRNEYYGFEIDYPVINWEFEKGNTYHPLVFSICKNKQQEKDRFCIFGEIYSVLLECLDYDCKNFIAEAYECFLQETYPAAVKFKKEIITNTMVKGCETIRNFPGEGVTVFFKLNETIRRAEGPELGLVLLLTYYKNTIHTQEEIDVFNEMVSSFRFTEK